MSSLYVAAARDLPASFIGSLCIRAYVGGSSKASWQSEPAHYDGYCAWDWRNSGNTLPLEGRASLTLELWWGGGKQKAAERCAGAVFVGEEEVEGWRRLESSRGGGAAMGWLYVRVGPPLVHLTEAVAGSGKRAIYLEEELPVFEAESAFMMEPSPDASLPPSRTLSLAVSLCDVQRVRLYLLNGGSIHTPVIIARGISGTPLEATCANCPSAAKRKRLRIEFDGGAYSRLRCAADAVAIARLLLLCGAVHDARSVRWLYDNAGSSVGKQMLMRVLDPSFYSSKSTKKKKEPKQHTREVLEPAPMWGIQNASPPSVRQGAANVKLGGGRRRPAPPAHQAPDAAFLRAQEALARPIAALPEEPDVSSGASGDEKDAPPTPPPKKERKPRGHGFAPRPEGESSDLEEESSSTDEEERARRAARQAKDKAAREKRAAAAAAVRLAPSLSPPPSRIRREEQEQEQPADVDAEHGEGVEMVHIEDELSELLLQSDNSKPSDYTNESQIEDEEVMMDWGGIQTDASFIEVGEEAVAEDDVADNVAGEVGEEVAAE